MFRKWIVGIVAGAVVLSSVAVTSVDARTLSKGEQAQAARKLARQKAGKHVRVAKHARIAKHARVAKHAKLARHVKVARHAKVSKNHMVRHTRPTSVLAPVAPLAAPEAVVPATTGGMM